MIKLKQKVKNDDDPLESKIENDVKKYAKNKGFYVRKFSSPSHRSVPDDLFITPPSPNPPVLFFIEFKRKGKSATPAQICEHELIEARGMRVYIVDNIQQGKELIDAHYK